jgi:hypothetical protein
MDRLEALGYLLFCAAVAGAMFVAFGRLHALAVRRGWVKPDEMSEDDTAW